MFIIVINNKAILLNTFSKFYIITDTFKFFNSREKDASFYRKKQKSNEVKMLSDHFTFLETNISIFFFSPSFQVYTSNVRLDKERYTIT